MGDLNAKKRNALSKTEFADPENRKYPVPDKAHADNAAARLEQEKGSMSSAKYAQIKARIRAAQRRFGEKKKMTHVAAKLGAGGSLHIRHMGDAEHVVVRACEARTLSDVADGPVWNQLAVKGAWKGHPQGPFVIDSQTLSDIVRNFNATQNRDVPIDYEHASEQDPTSGSIPQGGAVATGHIKALEIRNGELWGLVEWTDKAKEQIRAGEYKYFSPAIRFNAKDRVTGARIGAVLSSGALTNKPFLDGMAAMAASETAAQFADSALAHKPHEYMPAVRRSLKLHDLATARECADHLEKLRTHFDAAGQDPDATHEGVQLGDYCMSMRNLVGASPGATWDDVFDAIEDLIHAAMDEHEIEYHGGEEPAQASLDDDQDGDTPMSDQEKNELVTLREKTSKLETDNAELTVKLTTAETTAKNEKDRADKAEAQLAQIIDAQNDAEVSEVIARHAKDRGYGDTLKPHLLSWLKSNPDGFRAVHPRPDPKAAILAGSVVKTEKREDARTVIATANGETESQMINRLMKPKAAGGEGLPYNLAAEQARLLARH